MVKPLYSDNQIYLLESQGSYSGLSSASKKKEPTKDNGSRQNSTNNVLNITNKMGSLGRRDSVLTTISKKSSVTGSFTKTDRKKNVAKIHEKPQAIKLDV